MFNLLFVLITSAIICSASILNELCVKHKTQRIDCLPDISMNKLNVSFEEKCLQRNCCFERLNDENFPFCFYPDNYTNYVVTSENKKGLSTEILLESVSPVRLWPPHQSRKLKVVIDYINKKILRVKIQDIKENEFISDQILEKPLPIDSNLSAEDTDYKVFYRKERFSISVVRKSTNTAIFDTSVSSLLYARHFKQITSNLGINNSCVYGLAERNSDLCITTKKRMVYTFFNRGDQPEERNDPQFNLYGYHPLYMALEDDGSAHGVYLHNTHALDVVIQPGSSITYRMIGGNLDFFFLLGPMPDEVTSQHTSIIGRPFLPPYWALGFHLCRYNYNSIQTLRNVWKRNIDAGIPFDTQWSDIDYMDNYKDFTFDPIQYKGLPEFIREVHAANMKYVINISPGLSPIEPIGTYEPYEIAKRDKILILNPKTNTPLIGKCWHNQTVWIDFSNPDAVNFWFEQLKSFHKKLPFDGIWLDMNEPYSFRSLKEMGCDFSDPLMDIPYIPGREHISNSTLCMYANHFAGTHFEIHTLYTVYESKATSEALKAIRKGKRPWILSRASSTGQGRYSSHWNGDVTAEWPTMRRTIANMLTFNIIGMPFVGADICGFMLNTTEPLCLRWHQLGAFYTFSRNHNDRDTIHHDPVAMGPRVTLAAKKSLELRYSLLPYLYTLLFKSHLLGTTVARPLFYEFPNDNKTHKIDDQFMWGSAIMFNPVLHEDTDVVNTYFPKGQWFSNFKEEIFGPMNVDIISSLELPNINFRAGYIVVMQNSATNTVLSRRNPFKLIVYIDKETNKANGELYWDDGESEPLSYTHITFEASKRNSSEESYLLLTNPIVVNYKKKMIVKQIEVFGVNRIPNTVICNSRQIDIETFVKVDNNILYINLKNETISLLEKNEISWMF